MRLKCQIEVVNRNVASHGLRSVNGKAAQATLFLARKPGDIVFLIYCTAKDKQGTKFKVNKNVEQIFIKFVKEGKATIRLVEPQIDICINKANVNDLKKLLQAIKMAHSGQTLSGHGILSSMAPAKTKHVEKPKTKLVVLSRKEYPTTTSFPSTLESLVVSECNLARFDSRMFNLKNLSSLDLSCNKIKILPKELAEMQSLNQLILAKNEITDFPSYLCIKGSNFCRNLRTLDLSHNKLAILPQNFCNLSELWSVQISHNRVTFLPQQIGNLVNLRRFLASNNCLSHLPYSFSNFKLERLDLFMNPFLTGNPEIPGNFYRIQEIPSLQELSARNIRKNNTFYDNYEYVPFILIKYLNSGKQCPCHNYCFTSCVRFLSQFDLSQICSNLTGIDHTGRTQAPINAVICSQKCMRKYV